jgi:hypothetical protein
MRAVYSSGWTQEIKEPVAWLGAVILAAMTCGFGAASRDRQCRRVRYAFVLQKQARGDHSGRGGEACRLWPGFPFGREGICPGVNVDGSAPCVRVRRRVRPTVRARWIRCHLPGRDAKAAVGN